MASPTKAKPAGQKPVTAHPLFPAIVALWFAALIGIGSLVLPQALYDQAGAMMGLGTLGLSARIGVAVAAGLVGGALGMIVARKAAASQSAGQPAQTRRAQSPKPSVRPISAMEELGSDRLDEPVADLQPGPITGRRRSLSLNDESGPSDYLAQVPLPGGHTTMDLIGAEILDDDNALELSTFAEPDTQEPVTYERAETAVAQRQVFQPAYELPETQLPTPAAEPAHGFGNAEADWTTPTPHAEALHHSVADPAELAPRPFSPPPSAPFASAQPAPFSAQPAPMSAPVFGSRGVSPDSASLAAAARPVMAPFTMPAPAEPAVRAEALAGAALPAMALADLIDRFAEALRRADPASLTSAVPEALRQYAPAADKYAPAADQTPEPALAPPVIEAGEAACDLAIDTPAPAPGAFAMPSLPTALMPIGYDDGEDGDEDYGADDDILAQRFEFPLAAAPSAQEQQAEEAAAPALSAAPFGLPRLADPAQDPASASIPEIEDDDPEADDTFGSLLAMKSGFGPGREFVRIEDEPEPVAGIEPVVVFPGMASPGRATPAADGPSREAVSTAADAPAPFAPVGVARLPFGVPQHAATAEGAPVDRTATEQALRDALAKLQQMSGAA